MPTYVYQCDCMDGEVEVEQRITERPFTTCLPIHERLNGTAPKACAARGGHRVERLIAPSAAGIIVKGAKASCSLGEKAAACGAACGAGAGHGAHGHCPFG